MRFQDQNSLIFLYSIKRVPDLKKRGRGAGVWWEQNNFVNSLRTKVYLFTFILLESGTVLDKKNALNFTEATCRCQAQFGKFHKVIP